ncbi:MAG: helix-hairpin-helix domain-containing protein [Pseudonocardiales bacterium]|nr:helix-hairpin-helix domain-containing protein [Pseudonocardiales bacterium]
MHPLPASLQTPMSTRSNSTNHITDINSAGPNQLAALPGFSMDRAQRVITERNARHGFATIEEFANTAGLAPHEYYRIRNLVKCTPPQHRSPTNPRPGRIVDL